MHQDGKNRCQVTPPMIKPAEGARLKKVCTRKLLHREQLEDVTVRVAKVDATSAASMIDVHIR